MTDGLTRLPRGRHQLTREQVAESQRTRMLMAMADAMTDKGFVSTSVADVLKGAGVSRETFYQQFSSKLDCFLATFDGAGELLMAQLTGSLGAEGSRLDRFATLLATYLHTIAAEPAYARLFLVEVYAAGTEALERRAVLQRRIVDAMVDLLGLDPADTKGRFACEFLVAGIAAMITPPLVANDLDAIRALHDPIVDLVAQTLDLNA